MNNKCLYCYQPLAGEQGFHEKCSNTFFGVSPPPEIEYSLDQMDALAKNVIERSIAIPGVQPKLSMSLLKEKTAKSRLTVVDALNGRFVFKPPSPNLPEMPANEHVTMRIAEAYGIRVVPSSLIRLASGELSYITKRIDRTDKGEKKHMLDMFQITEAFEKYRSSMEKVGKALGSYSDNPLLDKTFYFDLALFSFLTGNNDMHLKNFSMIEQTFGWGLSPAYDLLNVAIVLPEDEDELALTLCGKRKKLKRKHFEQLGSDLGLTNKQVNAAFKRMINSKQKAVNWIDLSFLSSDLKNKYIKVLHDKYTQLELT